MGAPSFPQDWDLNLDSQGGEPLQRSTTELSRQW